MDEHTTLQLHTGNRMPILGLGTWQLTNDPAGTIRYALDNGFPLIDTSSDYGTQPAISQALEDGESVFIVTKVEEDDDAYERTLSNLDELGTDSVDLMLIHRPPATGAGEDLWKDLIRARDDGLVQDIGVSNYDRERIEALIDATGVVPVVNQIEWSPFGHDLDMLAYAQDRGMIIQAYSPLTRGERLDDPDLERIAAKHGVSPAQVLIRWNLQLGTCPIPKANQRRHLDEGIDVFGFSLSDEDMEALGWLNEQYSSLGGLPYVRAAAKT